MQWLRPCCLLRTMHVACCVLPGVWHHCSPTKPPAIAPPLKLRQCTPQVTLRCGGRKPLLIKSPVHTARVALLLKLFPRARFVYVHRDPLTTFCSAAHMVRLSSCVRPLLGGTLWWPPGSRMLQATGPGEDIASARLNPLPACPNALQANTYYWQVSGKAVQQGYNCDVPGSAEGQGEGAMLSCFSRLPLCLLPHTRCPQVLLLAAAQRCGRHRIHPGPV